MAGTNSGTVLEGSRMLFALSLDRRMGPISRVNPKFHTPTVAIVIHVAVAAVFSLAGSFAQLAMLSAVARLSTYLFTCAGIPFIRKKLAGDTSVYVIVLAILGTVISLTLFLTLNRVNFLAAAIAITVGALVYVVSRPATAPARK
jgi:amino acid transporter